MGIVIVLFACGVALGLLYLLFWISAVKHTIQNDFLESWEKLAWIFGMICFPFLGVIFYWVISGNNQPQAVPQKSYRESELV